MKNERIEILQKVANGELTPEQADEQLLGLLGVGGSALQFKDDMFKLINAYAKNGLSKPDLVSAMEWMTGSCKMS